MGKINDNLRNVRKNTAFDQSEVKNNAMDISQDELDPAKVWELVHNHEWHFAGEYYDDVRYTVVKSKFACLCGAVKRVKQFEVEE